MGSISPFPTSISSALNRQDPKSILLPENDFAHFRGIYAGYPKPDNSSDVIELSPQLSANQAELSHNFAIYTAKIEQYAFSLTMLRENGAATSTNLAETEEIDPAQILFKFYESSRTDQLTFFENRTDRVAEQLQGPTQQSYIELSRRIGIRFQLTIQISGAALEGFAKTSEALADSAQELFDKFLQVAKNTLAQGDEFFNMIFEMLNGFLSLTQKNPEFFDSFIRQLFGTNQNNILSLSGSPGNGTPFGNIQQFQFQLEFTFVFEGSFVTSQEQTQEADPLILDLNGNGIEVTRFSEGAQFDITGSGKLVKTAFVTGGDAFLAIDRNGNGIIDNGKELFGDQNGVSNGFEELRKLDSNGDGKINQKDKDFDKLLVWRDNGNGTTEPGELLSLREIGIKEINLSYRDVTNVNKNGNRVTQISSFIWEDGRRGKIADVQLNYLV